MTKRNSFMDGLAKVGLVENDTPPPAKVLAETPPSLAPTWSAPVSASMSFAQPTLTAEDQARMKALEAQVYAIPSTYVMFQRVRDKMGASANVQGVFDLLSVVNPGVTPAKVLADIDAHLGVIASKRTEFDAQVDHAKAERVFGPKGQIDTFTAANTAAQATITANLAKIADLQKIVQESEQSISEGVAHFKIVEDQLSAPLLQTKQLLSGISQ